MLAIPLIGGVVSAVGTVMGAQAAGKAADYNAAVSRANAKMSRQEGQLEIDARRKEMRQTLGSIRAAYGSSGVQFVGSGLDLLRDTAVEYAWDTQKIAYKAEVRAVGEENQAQLYEAEAGQATSMGVIGAASSLLKGATTSYGMYSDSQYGGDLA